jgi:hypothetical protein
MRLLTAIGVAVLVVGMSAPLAYAQAPPRLINQLVPPGQPQQEQEDLSRLFRDGQARISIELKDVQLDEMLDAVAMASGFEVYFNREAWRGNPVSVSLRDANVETFLSQILNQPGIRYTVVEQGVLLVHKS